MLNLDFLFIIQLAVRESVKQLTPTIGIHSLVFCVRFGLHISSLRFFFSKLPFLSFSSPDSQLVKFGSRRVMCHPEFRMYLVSRSSRPAFSTEVSSITTIVNLRLDEEALAEEIQLEAFHRVQPHLYVEGRKCLMVMMELLRLLENIDSKLIGLVTARQGTDIWEETEVIAELVNCRTEVGERSFWLGDLLTYLLIVNE